MTLQERDIPSSHCIAETVRYFGGGRRRDPKHFLAPQTVLDDGYTPVDTSFLTGSMGRSFK
jgi:hypothetical protein